MCQLCCNPAGEKSCCCFNLSTAMIVIAAYFGAIGGLDIWQAMTTVPENKIQYGGGILTACIGGYVAICVIFGILRLGIVAYLLTMLAFVVIIGDAIFKLVVFIWSWVVWGNGLSDGTIGFQPTMVTFTISQLLSIAVVSGFANLFWSAACVYKAGGTGCEYKTYKQLESANTKKKEQSEEV